VTESVWRSLCLALSRTHNYVLFRSRIFRRWSSGLHGPIEFPTSHSSYLRNWTQRRTGNAATCKNPVELWQITSVSLVLEHRLDWSRNADGFWWPCAEMACCTAAS